MLLNELTGVKKYYNRSFFQIEKMLRKFGITFAGGGRYGKIFTCARWDYVVKMFNNDPHYLGFVNYALAHPNKHYPKFVRKPLQMHAFHKRFSHEAPKFWIVKIEKLKELERAKADFIVAHLERAEQYWYNETYQDRLEDYQKRLHDDHWTWAQMPDGNHEKVKMKDFVKMYPWLLMLAEAWHNIFENVKQGSPDLHAGNFMQREDGTVVIIDPLWEGSSPEKDYQEWLARETDAYSGYYEDEPTTRGPQYLIKREQAKQQAEFQATRAFAQELSSEDIPF